MERRPFGRDMNGEKICDVAGVVVRANVELLEESLAARFDHEVGQKAVRELSRLLNERIRDHNYHVQPAFLKNHWNSYSYEFVMFLSEFCIQLSGDPQFQFTLGRTKFITPMIQVLGRPFSIRQIYAMYPYFVEKYTKGVLVPEPVTVADGSAVMRLSLSSKALDQFGPYQESCAKIICDSAKATIAAVPERMFGGIAASIEDRRCMSKGDPCCEWLFSWAPQERPPWLAHLGGVLTGVALFTVLHMRHPTVTIVEALALSMLPWLILWLASSRRQDRRELAKRERTIHEQLRSVESQHEELREAYLEQEQVTVELKRKIGQLTLLHQTSLIVSSTLDRETLLNDALAVIKQNLHFDRVLIAFFDRERKVSYDARVIGVPEEVSRFARSLETPITDTSTIEGKILLEGTPVLVKDVEQVGDQLHPLTRQLVASTGAKSFASVPLKVQDRVIGSLTADRLQDHTLTDEDLGVLVTVASQLAIALDHASAYRQIEDLNVSLEAKVQERTAALEEVNRELHVANHKLRELDELKSTFVSTVSHELRTPMTSIKGYIENMLDGLTGSVTEKQVTYLNRIKYNVERLTRLVNDLLDLSRIEVGRVELHFTEVNVAELVSDVIESLGKAAQERSLLLHKDCDVPPIVADRDKLHQVLVNLIHNAIKFTSPGGEVFVTAKHSGPDAVELCVADTGSGIPPHEVGRVFEKFYRADSAPARAKGAGLGLAITKSLVELHHGQIRVDSVVGKGTRFFVTLPLAQPTRKDSSPTHPATSMPA